MTACGPQKPKNISLDLCKKCLQTRALVHYHFCGRGDILKCEFDILLTCLYLLVALWWSNKTFSVAYRALSNLVCLGLSSAILPTCLYTLVVLKMAFCESSHAHAMTLHKFLFLLQLVFHLSEVSYAFLQETSIHHMQAGLGIYYIEVYTYQSQYILSFWSFGWLLYLSTRNEKSLKKKLRQAFLFSA